MKKIAVGDLGEFWYGDYKEPFVQLEGAVTGYPQGVVLKDDDGKLLCAYCGRSFHNLGVHTASTHGLKASEYKREVGLLQRSALVSETQRLHLVARALRRGHIGRFRPQGVRVGQKRPEIAGTRNGQHTPEKLNRTGRCYAQLLARARTLAGGKSLSQRRLRQHGIGDQIVVRYFGGMDNLNRLVKQLPNRHGHRLTDEQLISGLRHAALELRRTPGVSDLRRLGLSSDQTYRNRFGSYANALGRAGLTRERLPVAENDAVAILNLYAITGRVNEVARLTQHDHQSVSALLRRYGIQPLFGFAKVWGRAEQRDRAGEVARRLAGWPDTDTALTHAG